MIVRVDGVIDAPEFARRAAGVILEKFEKELVIRKAHASGNLLERHIRFKKQRADTVHLAFADDAFEAAAVIFAHKPGDIILVVAEMGGRFCGAHRAVGVAANPFADAAGERGFRVDLRDALALQLREQNVQQPVGYLRAEALSNVV